MKPLLVDRGLEVLDEAECRRLIETESVGRVAVCVDALPAIFPVNFRVVDNSIAFRTAEGGKFAAATNRAVVAFEVDSYDTPNREGWSVLVVGTARPTEDEPGFDRIRPWASGDRDHLVVIPIELISGRRIRREA